MLARMDVNPFTIVLYNKQIKKLMISDVFPTTLSFGFEEIGDVKVYVVLSNLVSKTIVEYNFTLVEKIDNLQLKAQSTASSGFQDLLTSSIVAAEGEEVKFLVTVDAGSHVEYVIDYGDGNYDAQSSPVLLAKDRAVSFSHQYEQNGKYDVNITAKNVIHSLTTDYPSSISVLEIVDNVAYSLQYIDYDEKLYDSSIFDSFSELFVAIFASPATPR